MKLSKWFMKLSKTLNDDVFLIFFIVVFLIYGNLSIKLFV